MRLNASVLKLLMIQCPGYFGCIFVTFLERKFYQLALHSAVHRMQVFVLGISLGMSAALYVPEFINMPFLHIKKLIPLLSVEWFPTQVEVTGEKKKT